jgi:hypothetical protein
MFSRLKSFLWALMILSAFNLKAQNWEDRMSFSATLIYFQPFTDLNEVPPVNNRLNLGIDAGISYDLNNRLHLRGNWIFGMVDGGEPQYGYFETVFNEAAVFLDYDIMPWLKPRSKYEWHISGGAGMMFFYSNLFDQSGKGKELIARHPSNDVPWTYAGTVNIGTSLHIPVSKRFSLTLGADLKYMLNTDYLDAYKDAGGSDMLGTFEVGISFELGRSLKEDEVITKKSVYDEFINQEGSAQAELTKAKQIYEEAQKASEQIEKEREETAKAMAEKDQQIAALKEALAKEHPPIDPANGNKGTVETDPSVGQKANQEPGSGSVEDWEKTIGVETAPRTASASSKNGMWHVVLGSFRTEEAALSYVQRKGLDKQQIVVRFVETLKTYRLIHSSFSDQDAAGAAQDAIKDRFPKAWIIQF